MAIRRVDTDENEGGETEKEDTAAAAEKARAEREAALEERARELELKNARAEAALEESRRKSDTVVPQSPTEAQWQELEAQNLGKNRQEIQAEANKIAAIADSRNKPIFDRASAAEERAAKAEERAARLETRRTLDRVEDKFYKTNPALEPHRAEVESFLAEFPDNDKLDTKTYEKRLGLAREFVKGRVKDMRSESRRGEFSSRHIEDDGRDDRSGDEFDGRFDPKGTGGNRGAIALCEGIIDGFGNNLRVKDSIDVWKKSQDEEGRGVEISSMEEVERARDIISRGSHLGGKKGEK